MIDRNYHFENYVRGFISADLINDPIRDLFREYQHIQKDSFTEPPERRSDEAERRLENIFYYCDKLTPKERKTVLESILQNDRNIYFEVYLFNNQEKDLEPEIWLNIKRLVNREIGKYLDSPRTPDSTSPEPAKTAPKEERTPHQVIALMYAYKGQMITRQNCNSIARKYGQTSGAKLKSYYDRFQYPNERRDITDPTPEKYKNQIKRIEAAKKELEKELSELPEEISKKIDSDIEALKKKRKKLKEGISRVIERI